MRESCVRFRSELALARGVGAYSSAAGARSGSMIIVSGVDLALEDRRPAPNTNAMTATAPNAKSVSPGDAHPAQRFHIGKLHELRAPGIRVAMLHGGPCLDQADRKDAQHDHRDESDVHRPETDRQPSLVPSSSWHHGAHAKENESDPEHAVYPEERGYSAIVRFVCFP
jgi:hypothetical protein